MYIPYVKLKNIVFNKQGDVKVQLTIYTYINTLPIRTKILNFNKS